LTRLLHIARQGDLGAIPELPGITPGHPEIPANMRVSTDFRQILKGLKGGSKGEENEARS